MKDKKTKRMVIDLKINSWNEVKKSDKQKIIIWMIELMGGMARGERLSDDFTATYSIK